MATITQVVNYAAANVPAEWATIINAANFTETLTGDTIRVFDSAKPVHTKTNRATMFAHGEINNQTWASNLGMNAAVDQLIVTSKKIEIIKGNRKMVVFLTWHPNAGYSVKIAVYNK